MTCPEQPSELDIQDVIRRRTAEMHQQVDTWAELTLRELGVEITEEPEHTVGISFEPGVVLQAVPQESDLLKVGFYRPNSERQIEVVPGVIPGQISFEVTHDDGQVQDCAMDQELFALLFVPERAWKQRVTKVPKSMRGQIAYGVHPLRRDVAVRYNADGSVSVGRFGDNAEFISE